jgi:Cu+-exporting ATPase
MSSVKTSLVAACLVVSFGVAAAACAAEAALMPASSPANPAGQEAPWQPPAPASAAPAPSGSAGVVYVCPMHPEVTSPSPGRCPKCGMELQPRAGDGGTR